MTRTYKNLYPQIYDLENLWRAWRRARRGGKRKWAAVADFEIDLEQNLVALHEELRNWAYAPGAYRHFTIREPKVRRISAAPFRDRVVHHALMQVIWPIFEARMIHDSYACRVGKGTHRAVDRAHSFSRRYPYVLQCDVVQFFPAIDHAILRKQLARHIACPDTMALIDVILAGGAGVLDHHYDMVYFPDDDLFAANRPRGLPIGNLTSQNWANVYLNDLDQFVKHELRCRAYLRYADDFLLFAGDKATLWAWRSEIIRKLMTLRLTLHEDRAQVYPVKAGIPWLGFRVFPSHRRLKRRNVKAFGRRLRAQRDAYHAGRLTLDELHRSLQAWIAHAEHADTYNLRRDLMKQVIF
ncbi:MAG: group II intron reverse transcriptase domain-containing protein [Caldilineaceae bacterium]|nr:group II intron reverse transcriptase domain-containing protein [Caldilineaceae bacterium]